MRSAIFTAVLGLTLTLTPLAAQGEMPTANVSLVGLIAKTHAVRRPTPGGFGNTLELTFIRFLEKDPAGRELTIEYKYEWATARPDLLGRGSQLLDVQRLTFPTPNATDRACGYQTSYVKLQVAAGEEGPEAKRALHGQHFRVTLLASSEGKYAVVDENGRLVRELNRRYAERAAECYLYEGCVIACLPGDRASVGEPHAMDAQDLDQFVPDCYLIAALAAAARRDPEHLRNLIDPTPHGFVVTFPGYPPVVVPLDLDRGPDMVQTRVLDINARGEIELWPIILERAFLVLRCRTRAASLPPGQEFQAVCEGDAQSAYYILTGRPIVEHMRSEYRSRADQLRAIGQHLQSARPVMMSTGKWTQPGERPEWWREDHVYVVSALRANTLTLIDPGCGQLVERIKIGDWIDSTELKRFLFCE